MQQLSLSELFAKKHDKVSKRPYSLGLLLAALALFSIGFIMITSASIPIADRLHGNPYHFAIRHGIYILIASGAAMVTMLLPMRFWKIFNPYLLFVAAGLLLTVLIVGTPINGAKRWIVLGPITVQSAELAKLFFFLYLAGYLVRHYEQVQENIWGFVKPIFVLCVLSIMLLMQPDFGTVVVMFATTLALLFLAGARLWQFFALIFGAVVMIVFLIISSEYRKARITGFLNPWDDPFHTGYQLTQSLMAYGRGSWFGQGLGNSLQKLEFLPEAHTDFIMSILAEELGYLGVIVVMLIILYIIITALKLGSLGLKNERPFEAFVAYSIGVWFCLQTFINIGGGSGLLPTKGLTLPLVSYGGSSLIVMTVAVAILVRLDFEMRVDGLQAMPKGSRTKKSKEQKIKSQRKRHSSGEVEN